MMQVADYPALFDETASWTVGTGKAGHPHFSVLDFFGSVLACEAFRHFNTNTKRSALESVGVTLILQFGGTTLAHLLFLGQTPGWLTGHTAWASFLLAWWLTFACPFDLWHRVFTALAPLRWFIELGSAVSLAHGLTTWSSDVALAAADHRASASATCVVLCGTLSACGGGVVAQLLALVDGKHAPAKRVAYKATSLNFHRAFVCAFGYYWLRDPHFHWRAIGSHLGAGIFASDPVAARAAVSVVVLFLFFWDALVGGPSPLELLLAVVLRLINVSPVVWSVVGVRTALAQPAATPSTATPKSALGGSPSMRAGSSGSFSPLLAKKTL